MSKERLGINTTVTIALLCLEIVDSRSKLANNLFVILGHCGLVENYIQD